MLYQPAEELGEGREHRARQRVGRSLLAPTGAGHSLVADLLNEAIHLIVGDVGDRLLAPAVGEAVRKNVEVDPLIPEQASRILPAPGVRPRVLLDEVPGRTGERILGALRSVKGCAKLSARELLHHVTLLRSLVLYLAATSGRRRA